MSEESPTYGLTAAGKPRKRAPGAGRPRLPEGKASGYLMGVRLDDARETAYRRAAGKAKLSVWARAELDKAAKCKG